MDLRVIIPVKRFVEAKQRLSPALNAMQRGQLAERMFRHVFGTAAAVFGAANVLVVSRSPETLSIAETEGAIALLESEPFDLNPALLQAARFGGPGAHSKLQIVASDLPLMEQDEIVEMSSNDCAIAPDRHRRGTNALLWPSTLPFAFGENSFARHQAIAETAGLVPITVVRRGLAHDVDVPEDLNGLYL